MGTFDMEVAVLPDKAMTQPHAENNRTFWHESASQGALTHALHTYSYLKNSSVMRLLGQTGQRLGLILPAFAIILELNHTISLGQMLMVLVASVRLFGIGRILEGYSQT